MKRLFLSPANLLLAGLLASSAVAGFVLVPPGTLLPVHWGLDGQVDSLQPREAALLIGPGIALIVGAIFGLIMRFGERGKAEAGAYVLRAAFTAILLLALGVEATIVLIGLGIPVNMVQVVCLCAAALMVLIGNAMPKSQPNSFAGIRINTTLRDPANWQATHRLTGALFIAGGVLLVLAALLLPPSAPLLAVLIVMLLAPLVVGTFYSISLSRRHTKG